jgi:hypothetical protein
MILTTITSVEWPEIEGDESNRKSDSCPVCMLDAVIGHLQLFHIFSQLYYI